MNPEHTTRDERISLLRQTLRLAIEMANNTHIYDRERGTFGHIRRALARAEGDGIVPDDYPFDFWCDNGEWPYGPDNQPIPDEEAAHMDAAHKFHPYEGWAIHSIDLDGPAMTIRAGNLRGFGAYIVNAFHYKWNGRRWRVGPDRPTITATDSTIIPEPNR